MSKEVLFFTASINPQCQAMRSRLQDLQRRQPFQLRVLDMVPTNSSLYAQYDVRQAPTMVCHDGTQEVGRSVGVLSSASIESFLRTWGVLA